MKAVLLLVGKVIENQICGYWRIELPSIERISLAFENEHEQVTWLLFLLYFVGIPIDEDIKLATSEERWSNVQLTEYLNKKRRILKVYKVNKILTLPWLYIDVHL